MKKITVITTEGCTGCKVQLDNVKKVLEEYKDVALNVIPFESLTKKQINDYRDKRVSLRDFPTTIFTIDDVVTFRMTGSTAVTCIERYVDLYLYNKRSKV